MSSRRAFTGALTVCQAYAARLTPRASSISPSCVTFQRQLAFSEPPLPRGGGGGGAACAVARPASSQLVANICNMDKEGEVKSRSAEYA